MHSGAGPAATHREHPVALLLALVAVDGERRPAVLPQLPCQQVTAPLGLAEDLRHGDVRMCQSSAAGDYRLTPFHGIYGRGDADRLQSATNKQAARECTASA
jgi:hypothetical protein